MGIIEKGLLALVLASLLASGIVVQTKHLKAEREKNATLTRDKVALDATLHQLQHAFENHKKSLTQLQTENRRITTILAEREAHIERQQHDDPEIQPWAATPLPTPLIRLRHRPAANSASDFHPALPDSHPLLPASRQSADERRIESVD